MTINKLPPKFSKNVIALISGTVLAQLVPILVSPIITALYSPEDFGQFAIFMAIAGIIGSIATLRYEITIVLPDNTKDASNLLVISLLITAFISIITWALVSIYPKWLVKTFELTSCANFLYLIPVSVAAIGVYQSFNYWSISINQFRNNAISKITQTSSNALVNIVLGKLKYGGVGLVIGQITGQLISGLFLMFQTIIQSKNEFKGISIKEIKAKVIEYRKHAVINTSHVLIDASLNHGLSFFLLLFFGNNLVGLYAFSFRILKAPLAIIGRSMGQAFYKEASDYKNTSKPLGELILNIYKKQFLIGIIPFSMLFIFAPTLFEAVFGNNWTEAGVISQIITPWLFLNFIASPISGITIIGKKQRMAVVLTLIDMVLKFTALCIGNIYNDYLLAFKLISTFGCCLMVFDLIWYLKIAKGLSNN